MALDFKVLTLFPQMFPGPLGFSVIGDALNKGLWNLDIVNIRDYGVSKHNNVDDIMYGGGSGMVMRPDVLGSAIENNVSKNSKLLYPSPRGKKLTQKKIYELAKLNNIAIICGRFEGIDQRVIDEYEIEEVSLGDFVVSGGEIAAYALIDSCVRCLKGVLGGADTLVEESFSMGPNSLELLEYPIYTRPFEWKNRCVPEVLISGNHKKIKDWRLEESEKITQERRQDLWNKYSLIKGKENE